MHAPSAISVVITTHNGATHLAQTLHSVLGQTLPASELVVVDDGSTDDTVAVVQATAPQARLICQPNRGVAAARNAGLRAARSPWICLLDQDDVWAPDKLALQAAALALQPQAQVVFTSFVRWPPGEDGRHVLPPGFMQPQPAPRAAVLDEAFCGWVYHLFLLDCWMLTSTAMFSRAALEAAGGFDETLPVAEDWDLWLRMARVVPFAKLTAATTLYRQHPGQISRAPRDTDYRTALLEGAARRWGLHSADGRGISRRRFRQQLSRYHCGWGLDQVIRGNLPRADAAFLRAWRNDPLNWRALAYLGAARLGWRPRWAGTLAQDKPPG